MSQSQWIQAAEAMLVREEGMRNLDGAQGKTRIKIFARPAHPQHRAAAPHLHEARDAESGEDEFVASGDF